MLRALGLASKVLGFGAWRLNAESLVDVTRPGGDESRAGSADRRRPDSVL